MKKNNGFAGILGIVLAVGIIAFVGFYVLNKEARAPKTDDVGLPTPEEALKIARDLSEKQKTNDTGPEKTNPNKEEKPQNQTTAFLHLITPEQVVQMQALMSKNNKSLTGLQAYRFEKDELGMTHIRFYPYVNGIAIDDQTIYHFKTDGSLSTISNPIDFSEYSHLSTSNTISEAQAITIAQSRISGGGLIAQKEFWNKNMGKPVAKDIVLAWKVYPKEIKYPIAIIDANSGAIVYYDSGERF